MRVLVFGASSTQGYWDSQGGWADRLKLYYNELQMRDFAVDVPKVMNLGVSDDTTAHILKRLGPEAEARLNAKGVSFIIQVGTNNAAELNGQPRSTPELYKSELAQIIEKARSYSDKILITGFPAVDESKTTPVVWANMSFKNADIARYEAAASEVCEQLNVAFVPMHQQFLDKAARGEDLQAHDGLHPNDAGHQLIFELVRPALDEVLST